MKKYLYLIAALTVSATTFLSCSSDDKNDDGSEVVVPGQSFFEQSYFSAENAVFHAGALPAATTVETLPGVDMNSTVMEGATNFLNLNTAVELAKVFLAVDGVDGYLEIIPQLVGGTRAPSNFEYCYVIPFEIAEAFAEIKKCTVNVSGQYVDGSVTAPVQSTISIVETQAGDLEIKLAFNNLKDVDLHLYTPATDDESYTDRVDGDSVTITYGKHIFYSNRSYYYESSEVDEDGCPKTAEWGLDVDSNPACHIDSINKENIYIPEQFIVPGEYIVVVDMYSNCDPNIPTSWSLVAKYKGQNIRPTYGRNPATGTYPIGARNGDLSIVMRFTIQGTRAASTPSPCYPTEPTPSAITKMMLNAL